MLRRLLTGNKEHIFAATFGAFFLAVAVSNAVPYIVRGDGSLLYVILSSVHALIFFPVFFTRHKRTVMLAALIVVGSSAIVVKDPGDFSGLFLMSFAMIYGIKNRVIESEYGLSIVVIVAVLSSLTNVYLREVPASNLVDALLFLGAGTGLLAIEFGVWFGNPQAARGRFTETEIKYIEILPKEYTAQQVAALMQVSETTVKKTYARIRKKAGVKTNIGLVLWASEFGLI